MEILEKLLKAIDFYYSDQSEVAKLEFEYHQLDYICLLVLYTGVSHENRNVIIAESDIDLQKCIANLSVKFLEICNRLKVKTPITELEGFIGKPW